MKEFLTKSVFAPPQHPPETVQSTLKISLPAPDRAVMESMLHRGEFLLAKDREKAEETHSLASLDESSILIIKEESDSFISNPLADLQSDSAPKVPMPASARSFKPKRKYRSRQPRKAKSNALKENFNPNALRSTLNQI